MYNAHVKRLHSVEWRSLYGDTASMQELLLKTCTSSAWSKKVLAGTVTESCMAQDCSTHWRKQIYRSENCGHRTSSNNQSNHRHLRRKCHWMTLTRVLYGGPSLEWVLSTLDNIKIELKQRIGYTGSKGRLRKDLFHVKYG